MKNTLKQQIEKNKLEESKSRLKMVAEINHPLTKDSRRGFLKRTLGGGLALGSLLFAPIEDTIAETTSGVNRNSAPSDLKITDLRYCVQELV
jgi:hypothetical protein